MVAAQWNTTKWPEGVPTEISGYEKPLFSLLDDSADEFPDKVYTIFNDRAHTFSKVRDTANRIAAFLRSAGLSKGDRAAIFLPNLPHYPEIF